ncbi:hypothetical protein GGR56DRAFT_616320 [Xylariaceae sp. FL0804]|nr:hypothetical protein GGR56DRAFT_616320 [Xylariaceae sp. FL0804]
MVLKRGFLPSIHQPLPLNKRTSQKLLESITTSFRKNLDKEHPWQLADTPTSSHASARPPDAARKTAASKVDHRPTERHLRAILTNPLFVHDSKPDLPGASTRSPSDVFDLAVSRGLMTPQRAAGFLATVSSQIRSNKLEDVHPNPVDASPSLSSSGAGLRVLQWLHASGEENSLNFLFYAPLIRNLVPFLYAERLEEVLWVWLARLTARITELEFENTPGKANAQSLGTLLAAIIKETTVSGAEAGRSLDTSYAALFRARELLPPDNHIASRNMKSSWAYLSWMSTVPIVERPKPLPALFDSFLEMGQPYRPKLPMDFAHLELHHPVSPSHSAAVEYIRRKEQNATQVLRTGSSNPNPAPVEGLGLTAKYQKRLVFMAMDAAERLKNVGRVEEASWIERFLARGFDGLNLGILTLQDDNRV